MIIALPATGHDHLADALVRDLGFTRTHVDQPIRDLLLAMDPVVHVGGVVTVNRSPSPRLSSKLELVNGEWDRLLNPTPPSFAGDSVAAEVKRLLDVLRGHPRVNGGPRHEGDVVVIGVKEVTHGDRVVYSNTPSGASGIQFVAIEGRFEADSINYRIPAGDVVVEQRAIVAYVQEMREAKVVPDLAPWVGGPGTLQTAGNDLVSPQVTPDNAGSAHTALDSGSII